MRSILKNRRLWKWTAVLAVVATLYGIGMFVLLTQVLVRPADRTVTVLEQPAKEVAGMSSNVLVLGNTFCGRNINEWSMASPLKQAYPFSRLNEFHREQYDAWLSGLE